jgi:hypothetical protein
MIIREISQSEQPAYESLASECGSVFQSSAWARLCNGHLVRHGIFTDTDELVAGFGLRKSSMLGLTVLRMPPFSPQCGPFHRIQARNPVAVLEARRKIMEAIAAFLDRKSNLLVSLSFDIPVQDMLPFHWRRFKVSPRYTYRIDLSLSLAAIKDNMDSKRRSNLSKATRDGLTVRPLTDMETVRDLVLATFDRQNMRINREFIERILFQFAKTSNSYAYAAYRDETPIACAFIVSDRTTAYYLLGGYRKDEQHPGAGPLTILAAVQHAKEQGLQTFDFEGSMVPAIEKYFRGFGGQLTPYFSVNKAWLPVEMLLKCVKRELF